MKKKNKTKFLLVLGIVALVLVAAIVTVALLFSEDKKTSLTILEKRWIEDNKNKIIDFGITYDIPMYSLSEDGVAFNFLNDLEKDTGLEFNKVPYELSKQIEQEYYFSNTKELPKDNYILLDSTSYVLISKNNTDTNRNEKRVGILKEDKEQASYYLEKYDIKEYDSLSKLLESYNNNTVSEILLPYTTYLKSILSLKEAYTTKKIDEMKQYYIIKLSDNNKKLNSIIKKYYDKWSSEKKSKLYNKLFLKLYYDTKNIEQQKSNTLNAKSYLYGYVENLPYESIINNDLYGISGEYLTKFSKMSDVEFEYKGYKSIEDLKKALDNKEIDIAFGYYDLKSNSVVKTMSIGDTSYVIITSNDNSLIINDIKSLKDKEVSVVKNSNISDYLIKNSRATLKSFNTLKALLDSKSKDSIIAIDEKVYDYYRNNVLDDYQVMYRGTIDNGYNYIITDTKENSLFIELFNYYLSFTDNNYKKNGYNILVKEKQSFKNSEKKYLGYALVLMIVLIVIITRILKIGRQNKQNRREEKIRYVDMLTSLKNRNYLNSHMSEWNENKVYPQAIVVIDLNNIKYINDNYGYEEGDSVIGMAANILINTQLENTDIIRTDGNEFLVYMVGYDDKKVITYIRKLYKELQQLPHEFGAALGYSMIEDDIKTIDDAINEATLDMRKNKENLE